MKIIYNKRMKIIYKNEIYNKYYIKYNKKSKKWEKIYK